MLPRGPPLLREQRETLAERYGAIARRKIDGLRTGIGEHDVAGVQQPAGIRKRGTTQVGGVIEQRHQPEGADPGGAESHVGNRAVLADRFTVTGAAELPAADARLVSAALFEGAETAPDDEAVSDVTFSAAKVRSLWLVALLDHPTDRGGTTFPFSCRLLNARNVALADTGPRAVNVAPGDRVIVLRQRLTLLPKQRWAAGKYSLTCASGGVTFLRRANDLTK